MTTADWLEASVPVAAVNVEEVAFAATLTEDGTLSRVGTVSDSATTVLMVLGFDKVTVQVVLALEARLAAAHCSEDIVGRVTSESVAAWDEPFRVVVTVAV